MSELTATILFSALALAGCDSGKCVRQSDCASGLSCAVGTCMVVIDDIDAAVEDAFQRADHGQLIGQLDAEVSGADGATEHNDAAHDDDASQSTPPVYEISCPESGFVDLVIASTGFSPDPIEVSAGGIVKITNSDGDATHTVTQRTSADGDPMTLEGGFGFTLVPGISICVQFDVEGSYPYYCTMHTTMTGVVTVTP